MLIDALRGGTAICFMDDPVPIIDAGRWSQGDNNVSRYLRPYLESGEISIICEATAEALGAAKLKEPSFIEAFHRIEVVEPGLESARAICATSAERLGAAAGLAIREEAVDAAVELTRRFEPYRAFPGKALRVLEESVRESPEGADEIARAEVTGVFARRTGLPLALLSDAVALKVADVREHFETRVLGQKQATEAMVELITVIKAGLTPPEKPLGSFLFVGPTGVGKTELAKALAEYLFGSKDRVLRLDMGEYSSGDAVAKLIGSGWQNQGEGELTRRIREQPFSVVLLDEVEKANPLVFDLLLALIGEGRLTNADGVTADFRNAIVIMTSNLGATRSQTSGLGFASGASDGVDPLVRHYLDEAEKFFRPEFFNRIDRIVAFKPLGEDTIRQVARRELGKLLLREGITRRRLLVEVDEPVIEVLARDGFHPRYGARPLQRELERAVIRPLAQLVVEGDQAPGDLARVFLEDGRVAVELMRVEESRAAAGRPRPRGLPDAGTFAKAVRACDDLVAVLASENSAPAVEELRTELSELVTRTHSPTFWDESDGARQTLTRIYQTELVLDRFDALRRRADGLAAMARKTAASRARPRLREVWSALDEIGDALAVSRLELAGATLDGARGVAVVRVVPVGEGDPLGPGSFSRCTRPGPSERDERPPKPNGSGNTIRIEGLSTFDLLQGEAGLHRRSAAGREPELARVIVAADGADDEADGESGSVVRVYEDGKRRGVRDPRTGVRQSHLIAVLREGKIDAFLLGSLRARTPHPGRLTAVSGPTSCQLALLGGGETIRLNRALPLWTRMIVNGLTVGSPLPSKPTFLRIAPPSCTRNSCSVTEARVPSEAAIASSSTWAASAAYAVPPESGSDGVNLFAISCPSGPKPEAGMPTSLTYSPSAPLAPAALIVAGIGVNPSGAMIATCGPTAARSSRTRVPQPRQA